MPGPIYKDLQTIPVRITSRQKWPTRNLARGCVDSNNICIRSMKTRYLQSTPTKHLDFCLWNVRSIRNKSLALKDYIVDHDLDLFAVTETWLRPGGIDNYHIEEFCPSGYTFYHTPRDSSRGGGVGLLTKKSIQVRKHTLNKFGSFEYMDVLARVKNEVIRIVVIYRPPLSRQSSSTNFFDDFSTLAEQLAIASGNLLIVGDLNLHLDASNDLDAMKFQSILESFNLKQHVTVPTHVEVIPWI